jgi:hypothetical protein
MAGSRPAPSILRAGPDTAVVRTTPVLGFLLQARQTTSAGELQSSQPNM